jgi:hypothetical protein
VDGKFQQPKAFGAPFRVVFLDQPRELGPRKTLEQLIEETRDSSS